MTRSQLNPLPEYFDRYINKCDDVTIIQAIQDSIDELDMLPLAKWKAIGDTVYAPGKWTVRDVLQHLIDTERIFSYRALAFARGETQTLPPYDEEIYARNAAANDRDLEGLVAELRSTHMALKTMYASFTPLMLAKTGIGFKGAYSVASIGFLLPGHQRWHLEIVEEKYYPLLELAVAK